MNEREILVGVLLAACVVAIVLFVAMLVVF